MTDNCPRCGTTATAPVPHYDQATVRFRCRRCGHPWTATYGPEAYEITDDTLPRHWTEP